MKPYIIIFLLFLFLVHCKNDANKDWTKVDDHIKNSWDQYIGKDKMLPFPFSYAIDKQDLYYWDTYFTNKGLIRHEKWDIVLNNLNNYIFEIDSFGFIPNTNQPWSLDRSQPPFFSMMVKDYFSSAPNKNKDWLKKAYKAALKEYQFWTDTSATAIENHCTSIEGLVRYNQHCEDTTLIKVYNYAKERFSSLPEMNSDEKKEFGRHFFAECESGMDFSWRFQLQCSNYIAVDLNANLYMYEKNFAWFENELGLTGSTNWDVIANIRKELIVKYCWDKDRKLFADYNFVEKKFSPVASFCMLYPMLWNFATPEQAEGLKENLLHLLMSENGVIATQKSDAPYQFQWNHTAIWPPAQWVAYKALSNYNYTNLADEIAYKYLNVVTKNFVNPTPSQVEVNGELQARKKGLTWEKYTIDGAINDNEYPSNEMLGWTGGVFVELCYSLKD